MTRNTAMEPAQMPEEAPRKTSRGGLGRNRRTLLALGVVGVIVAVPLVVRRVAPVAVRAASVERGDLAAEVFGRGTIESEREAQLGFDLVGRVSDVLVDEGARVSLGQELARLNPDQVRADLRVAATGVAAARTSLQRLAAEETKARAAFEAAEREGRRARTLGTSGVIAPQTLAVAEDAVRVARAELDRVLAQRVEAARSIEVAEGGASQRQVTVLRATMLAPFDGLVTRRLREPGDTVTVGSTVLRLVDTERVRVRAWIDETVLDRVVEGQRAELTFPGGRIVPGTVTRVGWEADRQTHEILVDVAPSEPLGRIAIGQRVDVRITTQTRTGALRMPIAFIQRDEAGPYCFVDRDGRIAQTRLGLGLVGRDTVEILEGPSEGATVLAPRLPGRPLPVGRRWARQ